LKTSPEKEERQRVEEARRREGRVEEHQRGGDGAANLNVSFGGWSSIEA